MEYQTVIFEEYGVGLLFEMCDIGLVAFYGDGMRVLLTIVSLPEVECVACIGGSCECCRSTAIVSAATRDGTEVAIL